MGRFLKGEKDDTKHEPFTHSDIAKRDLLKKGINQMASDKLEEAIRTFDLALRIDPNYVDALIKKGYCHFHTEDFPMAISCYDKALEVDPNNAEAWNLKALVYYKMKNYEKAIESVEKAIDIDPNDGMAWYNRACYLALQGKPDESMDALKRAIEIDIDYAKKAVKDRDFANVREEIIFRRIVEVVVLEAIKRGNDVIGKMIWVTGMDREDIEKALKSLLLKGLIIKHEKNKSFGGKEESYTLAKELAEKFSIEKAPSKPPSQAVMRLKELIEHLEDTKQVIEKGDLEATLTKISKLIEPKHFGSILIENLFDQHRDLRVYYARLKDKGQEYLNANKSNLLELFTEIEAKINEKIRRETLA